MSEIPVKWTAAGLTPAGNALQAALLGTGDGLTFTRAVAADAEGVERLDLTLQSPCTVDGPKCRVPVLLTNAGVETGFTMTELRFYVRRVTDGAPTGEEVLYATVTDETGDPIPTAAQSPGFTIDWAFVFQFGNASEVMVTLDPVGLVSIGMVGAPNGVAGLGDNGAVPIAQGGTGETTAQGVIDAFGIFLAISAAAAYDPEGSYAVGDYCTHGGKLHKCGTPIESGEAWNAAHWTETTVAAELAEVKAELVRKADKTPPQEYDLLLADGITAATAATYCKTQEGIVIVYLGLSGGIGNWTTLGTLPEGVRPARTVNLLGFLDAGSTSTRYPIVLLIDSDGTIRTSYLAEGKSGTKVYGTFVFLAAS